MMPIMLIFAYLIIGPKTEFPHLGDPRDRNYLPCKYKYDVDTQFHAMKLLAMGRKLRLRENYRRPIHEVRIVNTVSSESNDVV